MTAPGLASLSVWVCNTSKGEEIIWEMFFFYHIYPLFIQGTFTVNPALICRAALTKVTLKIIRKKMYSWSLQLHFFLIIFLTTCNILACCVDSTCPQWHTRVEKIFPSWVLAYMLYIMFSLIVPVSPQWCGCLGGNDSEVQWRGTEW